MGLRRSLGTPHLLVTMAISLATLHVIASVTRVTADEFMQVLMGFSDNGSHPVAFSGGRPGGHPAQAHLSVLVGAAAEFTVKSQAILRQKLEQACQTRAQVVKKLSFSSEKFRS